MAREVGVDRRRGTTAFGDGPHDQTLTPDRVTAGEDGCRAPSASTRQSPSTDNVAREVTKASPRVRLIEFRSDEAGRDQDEVGRHDDGLVGGVVSNDDALDSLGAVELERLSREAPLPTFIVRG